MNGYPPGLTTGHDRAVWDLLMTDHQFCTAVSQWSQARRVVVDRCFCGQEWWLPRGQVRVTATVAETPPPPPPLALPAGPARGVAA